MRVVDHRQFRLKNKKRGMPRWLRASLIGLGALAGVFVLANVAMSLLYRSKVLPNYSIASIPIGNVGYGQLGNRVSVEKLLPAKVAFQKDGKTENLSPKELGVAVDWAATQEHIKQSRSWFPLLSLFLKHSVPAELTLDNSRFASATGQLESAFKKNPLPERIAFQSDNFAIMNPEPGYQVDVVQLRLDVITVLEQGRASISVPTTTTNSTEPTGKLGGELSRLQKQLDTKITLSYGGQSHQLGRSELAGFYQPAGQSLRLDSSNMSNVITAAASKLSVTAVNRDEAVNASLYAISKAQPVTFLLAGQGAKIYRYCTAAKGVDASVLTELRQKLAAVYGDPRGWNKGGAIAFVYAASDCNFTVWLSAAANMTSFGSICDNYYSCTVKPNVIINYDRWMGATDPWKAAGGSLEDYRVMVINHESGHWLGFGHRTCPGAGQLAPVMQQQSIDLQGCKFNPWPTAAELAAL